MASLRPAALAAFLSLACGSSEGSSAPSSPPPGPPEDGWVLAAHEDFEGGALPAGTLVEDPVPDDGPFADAGAYFTRQGIAPPRAFRLTQPFGADGWLVLEAYTRRAGAAPAELASVVPDPAGGTNRVLRVSPRDHTDGVVVRPARALPERYRVSVRVGWPRFGAGVAPNGYQGGETPEPWLPGDATRQNGFYWLTILDALPRPHNNVWIHHHRKVVVDSDNHFPPWMEIWNGIRFEPAGDHPIMLFALDGKSQGTERTGKPFLSYSAGAWQPSGKIRAVDRYLPDEWYRVTIERDGARFTVELTGRFRHGGERTVRAELDAEAECVWHWPATAAEAARASGCVEEGSFPGAPGFPRWPAGGVWPEWFMFGDPHTNYYEGEVYYDDVRLELPR